MSSSNVVLVAAVIVGAWAVLEYRKRQGRAGGPPAPLATPPDSPPGTVVARVSDHPRRRIWE